MAFNKKQHLKVTINCHELQIFQPIAKNVSENDYDAKLNRCDQTLCFGKIKQTEDYGTKAKNDNAGG